jgi:1,4-alpha-glucan branching enzyme
MARTKTKKETEFKIFAPEAKIVYVAGDFNRWDAQSLPLKKTKKGVWKVKVSLKPGKYQYKFFVDGQWQNDPHCQKSVPNVFGTTNSLIEV